MEVKHNSRIKKKCIPNPDTNITLSSSKPETIPIEALDTMTLERERWNTQDNSNQYEKVKLLASEKGFLIMDSSLSPSSI